MIIVPTTELAWLKAFFGEGNAVRWPDLIAGTVRPHWAQHILPWLRFLNESSSQRPLVLPVFSEQGPVRWYGLADGSSGLAQLTEEIQAFVGTAFSDSVASSVELVDADPIEFALKGRFGARALKFSARADAPAGALEQQIALYAKTLGRRPATSGRGRRPFGNIRADFDSAVLAGNASHASALIEELSGTGRLTADQRICLEIRRLAGLGHVDELARNDALVRTVMDMPLPAQTLTDLIGALFQTYIAPSINSDTKPAESIDIFRARITKKYAPLFRERKGIRESDVLKSFLLFEAGLESPDLGRCESIVSAFPDGADEKIWAEELRAWVFDSSAGKFGDPKSGGPSIEIQAKLAIGDEDYDRAATLCVSLLPRLTGFQMLLRCGVQSESSILATRIEDLVAHAPVEVKAQFDERDRRRLEQLNLLTRRNQQPARNVIWTSWASWVERDRPSLSESQELLKAATKSWRPDEYALRPEMCDALATIIGNASRDVASIFRLAFPDIVDFFVDRPESPCNAFVPIYIVLVKVLGWSGAATNDELQILASVLQALVQSAPSTGNYSESIGDVSEVFRENKSPNRIDWALDLCEMLAIFPCPDLEARLRLFVEISSYLRTIAHRLSSGQRLILLQLAKDYDCPEIATTLPAPSEESVAQQPRSIASYAGQIAIYTLSERSALNARATLEKQVPAARIDLNSDTVCTESLKNLARNADVFVFAWKKATHAAFDCVRDIRGLDSIVQPTGGGSASIVNAVVKALSEAPVVA